MGGLLFVSCTEYEQNFMVAHPGVSLDQLAGAIVSGHSVVEPLEYDWTETVMARRFLYAIDEEVRRFGVNRCEELCKRGGRVSKEWLDIP